MPTTVDDNIRKQAFWLYGVIIGLAVKEALTHVLPHIFKAHVSGMVQHLPEVLRLIVFLVLCVRFYLGAAQYFDEAYEKVDVQPSTEEGALDSEESQYKKKSFGLDFLFGFFHFLIFSALSLSISYDETRPGEISNILFPILLLIILLYDVLWLVANWRNDTFHLIKLWAFLNIATVAFAGFAFFITWLVYRLSDIEFNYFIAEMVALIILLLFSALDIAELIIGKPIIRLFLAWVSRQIASLAGRGYTSTI